MEIQLRDYRIRHGYMDDWIAGWRKGIVPLREQAGFQLLGAWVDRPHDRFVWVVGYAAPDGFKEAEERFHALRNDYRSTRTLPISSRPQPWTWSRVLGSHTGRWAPLSVIADSSASTAERMIVMGS